MKNIEQIIEKYYNGETSLEEELQLQEFFQGEDVPDHLKAEQAQFQASKVFSKQESNLSAEDLFAKLPAEKPKQPKQVQMNPWVLRIAAAVVFIVVGYGVAQMINNDDELDRMKSEMAKMKALMLEQMESSSASGRLQAVSNTMKLPEADTETIDALIEAMMFDESMHVRTKAVEALEFFGGEARVNKALAEALNTEREPAVQIAIINAMVSIKDSESIEELEKLTENEDVLKDVRDEARLSIFKLKEM